MQYLRNKTPLSLQPSDLIGQGGEAEVYRLTPDMAVKVFKPPTHPDYKGFPNEQSAAKARLALQQRKLAAFPKTGSDRVVAPIDLITDTKGKIAGYTMRLIGNAEVLLRYGDKKFRENVSNETVDLIFTDLHTTVTMLHEKGIIIGDFNDLNVLVQDTKAFIIDADSMQFGSYPCTVYTARFLDPLLATGPLLTLDKPYTKEADWYAFTVMLMQSLLFVDPYGGIFKPKDPTKRIPHAERPSHRITVFHPEVQYPKPAIPYNVLPDDLLEFFHHMFEKDRREAFPRNLLSMRWTTCPSCGVFHARKRCPMCSTTIPVVAIHQASGTVVATLVYKTTGRILAATVQNGTLLWLTHESGAYKREGTRTVLAGKLQPNLRVRLSAERTILATGSQAVMLEKEVTQKYVDTFAQLPILDANSHSLYWVSNGQLMKEGEMQAGRRWADTHIGTVLRNQTLFWVGEQFGFGFYRAGNLSGAFVFDAKKSGINTAVDLRIRGQLVDATCVFTNSVCWFLTTTRESGQTKNTATVVDAHGTILASYQTDAGDGSWLGTIRGKCAIGLFLFSPTDDGITRVSLTNNQIGTSVVYNDTKPYVDSDTTLHIGADGLYAVTAKRIYLLKLP